MKKKYSIANFNISAGWTQDHILETVLSPYECEFEGESDISVDLSYTDDFISAEFDRAVRLSDNKYYYRDESGNDVLLYFDNNSKTIISKVVFSPDYKKVNILAYNVRKIYDISSEYYLLNLFDNMMRYCMQMHSSFVFHASAIGCSEGGVVFSAKSGTGKSTHTSLWLQSFSDSYIINDDSPIIRVRENADVLLCGSPWAGTTGINTNTIVPLKGIVFLERSPVNTIERIPAFQSAALFLGGVSSAYNFQMYEKSLDTLNAVLSKVPAYILRCNMEPEAAFVARECIFNNN